MQFEGQITLSNILKVELYVRNYLMGILQSCEGSDPTMRVSLDEKLFRDSALPKYTSDDYFFKESKLRLFGDLLYRKNSNKTQFVLQTHHTNKGSRVINHSLRIYEDAASFCTQKGNKIKLDTPIDDPNIFGSRLFVGKIQGKPGDFLMKAVPFTRYEEEAFKRGLYEVAMLQKTLTQQNNRFGYVFSDAFVVQSGLDKDKNDKSLILIGEASSASLYEIINFRKLTKMPWSESQFENLCYQLIKGVMQLHKNKIAHRDIRPHNIYYCPNKHGYVLGGLQNSIKLQDDIRIGYNLCGVPYYLPTFLIQIGKRQNFSEYYNYQPMKSDIYALGVTLMNCLFLDVFTSPEILANSLQKYYTKYGFLRLIKQMISENPPNLKDVLTTLSGGEGWLQQKTNIEALRFRLKPQDDEFVSRKKIIAEGYYSMFLYDQWVQQINEVVNYYEMNKNHMQLGDVYKQIADIYREHEHNQLMEEYYNKASSTYLLISNECLEEAKTEQAIRYLQKGINCNRNGFQGKPNHDLAHLINKLALCHHKKGQYEFARAFQQESVDIIGKVYGTNSSQYAQMLIDSAKIQSEFQQFKQAENMLKAGVKIMQKKEETVENIKIKARLLQALGSNYRMKALQRKDKAETYRRKGEEFLLDALQLAEKIEGNISPQVGSILMSLGNIYFDKREFEKARKSYQKSLIIKQHTQGKRETIEVGECLTYLANSQKCLKQYEKSIKHYDEAIEVFRRAYNNDHNQNTAVAIGNLGLVYKQLGEKDKEREYINLAKAILKDLFGEQCPDYQYFDRQSK